jgi:hypothetical protein
LQIAGNLLVLEAGLEFLLINFQWSCGILGMQATRQQFLLAMVHQIPEALWGLVVPLGTLGGELIVAHIVF